MSRYLLSSLNGPLKRLRDRRVSFFLDFDGTLSPIASRPQDARLAPEMKGLLKALSDSFPVAVVSGRRLDDIKSITGLPGLAYAGNHGLEIDSPDFSMLFDPGPWIQGELARLSRSLDGLSKMFPGTLLEDKGLSLSLHYRLLDPALLAGFERAFSDASSAALEGGRVYLSRSKMAFEIKASVKWDKGQAVLWLLERPRFSGTFPLYIGDDETDMDAYRAIRENGISVHVGHETDEAQYHLNAQAEVKAFLEMALGTMRPRQPGIVNVTRPGMKRKRI